MYNYLTINFIILFFIQNINAQTLVANEKMNVLYIGLDNPLTIVVEKIPSNELEVNISVGTIEAVIGRANHYIAKVNVSGKIFISISHKGKMVEKILFLGRKMPDPVVILPIEAQYCKGGDVPITVIKQTTSIMAVLENFDFDEICTVHSFLFSIKSKNKDTVTIKNYGAKFNAALLKTLKNANIGDVISFEEVYTKCPDYISGRNLNDLLFSIIE